MRGRSAEKGSGGIDMLTWAHPAAPPNLDYVHTLDFTTPSVLSNSLEGLLAFDPDGTLQPSLAESWSQPDPLTYVYKLRPDVTFWNGDPLTADDVVFSLNQHIDPDVGSQWSFYYTSVDRIEASGDGRGHGAHEVARCVLPVHPRPRRGAGRPEEVRRAAREGHRAAEGPDHGHRAVRGHGVRGR